MLYQSKKIARILKTLFLSLKLVFNTFKNPQSPNTMCLYKFSSPNHFVFPLICFKIIHFLSYPPDDDRAGPWNTAMNAACVSHITWQLYHIGHVTSIVFHCFQGCPHHLAQLTSLWRHDFSPLPTIHRALPIDVAFSEIYFVHDLIKRSCMASLASFCGLFF